MKTLLNRRVLITGGGSGIGARTARAIVDRGGKVAVFDIEGEAAQRTAESLGAIQSLSFQSDVTDPEAIEGVLGVCRRNVAQASSPAPAGLGVNSLQARMPALRGRIPLSPTGS